MAPETFAKCGHPRTPENSAPRGLKTTGERIFCCRFCLRVRLARVAIDAQIERWRQGPKTLGQKIAEGAL
jgi:hypothetical protein